MTMTGTSHQTIAVMPFAGLYENEGVTELAGVLTYLVSELLRESPDLTVTELPLIDRLLDALELEKTDPVDITLGTQIGSLFSAGAVVTGTLKSIEADRLQLDITMMQIHRGEIYEFEPIVGTAVDLAASMRSLLDWMLSIFTSSPEATEMPMAEPEALLDFAKGRKFFDAGEYDKAAETFHRSLQRQPDFEQAKLSFHMVEKFVMAGAKMVGLDALEAELLREDMAVVSRQILLQQIDTKLGHGFMAVSEPQQVRGSGNQQFPGTDRSLTISVQWK